MLRRCASTPDQNDRIEKGERSQKQSLPTLERRRDPRRLHLVSHSGRRSRSGIPENAQFQRCGKWQPISTSTTTFGNMTTLSRESRQQIDSLYNPVNHVISPTHVNYICAVIQLTRSKSTGIGVSWLWRGRSIDHRVLEKTTGGQRDRPLRQHEHDQRAQNERPLQEIDGRRNRWQQDRYHRLHWSRCRRKLPHFDNLSATTNWQFFFHSKSTWPTRGRLFSLIPIKLSKMR